MLIVLSRVSQVCIFLIGNILEKLSIFEIDKKRDFFNITCNLFPFSCAVSYRGKGITRAIHVGGRGFYHAIKLSKPSGNHGADLSAMD